MNAKFSAGYGESIITPASDIPLAGYGYGTGRVGKVVRDDLKARALFCAVGSSRLLMVVCDLLNIPNAVVGELRQRIAEHCRIPADAIVIGAIHTHGGPSFRSDAYCEFALPRIVEAAAAALADAAPVEALRSGSLLLEPVGFNRRSRDFSEIDPRLSALFVDRGERPEIVLWNYACHPVVFGPLEQITADYPGEVNRLIAAGGGHGIFLQGCDGDIDPVTNLNCWGAGDDSDIEAIGELIYRRIGKIRRQAADVSDGGLEVSWRRFDLPLAVPADEAEIEREIATRLGSSDIPGADQFLRDWGVRAKARLAEFKAAPALPDLAMALITIGGARILTLPGEPFSGYSVKLAAAHPGLMVWAYSNGHAGYLPTAAAYADFHDYACYQICKAYSHLFPFTPDVEPIILTNAGHLLAKEGK